MNVGIYTRKLVIARYAKTGQWCATAKLLAIDVRAELRHEAERERALHLAPKGAAPCHCAGCLFPEERTR